MLKLYKPLVWTVIEYGMTAASHINKDDVTPLESIPSKATECIEGWESVDYPATLRKLEATSASLIEKT